jgi:hypothetical protein
LKKKKGKEKKKKKKKQKDDNPARLLGKQEEFEVVVLNSLYQAADSNSVLAKVHF